MAATVSKDVDSDIHITLEDQQKINRFARHNAKWEELREDLKSKKADLQNLEDASNDVDEAELADEPGPIPFVVGEVFVHLTIDEAREKLDESKAKTRKDIGNLENEITQVKAAMSDLKTQLYAKFGSSINLEADEE